MTTLKHTKKLAQERAARRRMILDGQTQLLHKEWTDEN